ncbi:MAG TPA: ABC transporter permease [Epsilonproteobacteria bacterium]|nr:ABC transporter permease [Campylobacterota bacterium]
MISLSIKGARATFHIQGDFTLNQLHIVEKQFQQFTHHTDISVVDIDLNYIDTFDSAAALLLLKFQEQWLHDNITTSISIQEPSFHHLFQNVSTHYQKNRVKNRDKVCNIFADIGEKSIQKLLQIKAFLAFFGMISHAFFYYVTRPHKIRYKEILFEMNESAIKALGIIALTTFLIGVVIAYQSSVQLKMYGANIFIVDMLGISILRELAPLITAIVIAGRSGSAYAAQIGVMKLTEELDAMRTMGFDPYYFLVLPRILALMVMMPLLIFFADIMGVLGGMLIASVELDITPSMFLERFASAVDIKHFYIGLFKGPFFAFLITAIGIFRGIMVKNDTQSIGVNTTKSVVESIFAVIMCDALFSIIFTNLGY